MVRKWSNVITSLKNSNKIEILHMGEKEWFKNYLTKVFTLPRHCSTTFHTFYCIKVIPVSVSLTPSVLTSFVNVSL